jgi:hypothetical protein
MPHDAAVRQAQPHPPTQRTRTGMSRTHRNLEPCPVKPAMVAPVSSLRNHSMAVSCHPRPSRTRCHARTTDLHLQGHGHKTMLSPRPMSTKPAPLELSVHGHDSRTRHTGTQLSRPGRDHARMRTHPWSHGELSAGTPCIASTRACRLAARGNTTYNYTNQSLGLPPPFVVHRWPRLAAITGGTQGCRTQPSGFRYPHRPNPARGRRGLEHAHV